MTSNRSFVLGLCSFGVALALASGRSSSDSGAANSAGGSGGSAGTGGMGDMDGAVDGTAATCASPGSATAGSEDMHCMSDDGGVVAQLTAEASCHVDSAAPDGGSAGCEFGATMFGAEGDDDDCKYHVRWTAGALCEGSAGVPFTVVVTNKTDGTPATGAMTMAEVFTATPGDASCDDQSTHPGPNSGVMLEEGPSGTYNGSIQFDQAGQWTVRFHMHHDCADVLEDSPHGHAAFRFTLP